MPTEADPIEGTWYCHLDKGQRFFVVAMDEATASVDVQHFDGSLEEFDMTTWYQLDIEVCEAPENWSGPLDIGNVEDLGTEITDTRPVDWDAPLNEYESKDETLSEE